MVSDRRWSQLVYLIMALEGVEMQFAAYPVPMMPPPPPIFAMPAPPPMAYPVPMPAAVAIPFTLIDTSTSTTTAKTTSTDRSIAIGLPFPMPMPIQIAIPALPPPAFCRERDRESRGSKRPERCPPCPPCQCQPSCTPAFFSFCSPCHKKCRCRSKEDTPIPDRSYARQRPRPVFGPAFALPMVYPPPPPAMVMVPYPSPPPRTRRPRRPKHKGCNRARSTDESSSDDSSSYSSSSSEYDRRTKRKKYTYNKKKWRRSLRTEFDESDSDTGDNQMVKPILSYISKDGNVHIRKKISNHEAAELLGDKSVQAVRISAGEDADNRPRLLVSSQNKEVPMRRRSNRQVKMDDGASDHVLGQGKKELIFRPPKDKQINNLTVSFQIA